MKRTDWKLALSVGPAAMNGETLSVLADLGIHEIELSSGRIAPFYEVLDYPTKARSYTKLAADHGVNISSVHLPFSPSARLDPSTPNPEWRALLLQQQSELLRAAADAGVGIAVLHPSGEPYPDEERKERLERACEVVGHLTEVATESGITLALENLPRTCLGRTSAEMLYFLDRIPDLRVCFDTNHSLIEDNVHFIHALGDKIVTLHVSDYNGLGEQHWLPLEGINPWQEILAALEAVGYAGRFLFECGGEGRAAEVRRAYDRLMKNE